MGVSHIRKYCLQGEQQDQKPNHYIVLAEDYRKFEADRWYTFQNPILFDPNKFIFLYPNYQEEQEQLLQRWRSSIDIKNIEYGQSRNEEDVLSTRWKYAIKRGVPVEYYKTIISVIFNKSFTNLKPLYDKLKNQTSFIDPVPLFGLQHSNLKESVHAPFLNERGFSVLRQLMFLLRKKKGQLFYNPYIAHIAAILLIFFQDYQTYELICTMMEESSNMSLNRLESLRWHMVFKQDQMKNLALSFYHIVGNNSQTVGRIQKYLVRHNIDKVKLFNRVVENFFYGFIPFPFILRVFILFLNEGVKMFFRVFYALIVYSQQQLEQVHSLQKAILVLRKKCLALTPSETTSLLKNSFNLNLKATLSTKLIESRLKKEQSDRKYFFLPLVKGASNVLSYDHLQLIWGFLPFELKTYDLELKYPPSELPQHLELKQLLKSLEKSQFNLIVVKTVTQHIFGCFFIGNSQSQESSNWYGNNQSFVFSLTPKAKKYASTRQNNQYLFTAKDGFKVGNGGAGSAIFLRPDLSGGESYKCFTFRNEPLNGVEGSFEAQHIEAFSLY